jgi:hypothetical protein
VLVLVAAAALGGCVTVRPEDREILSDATMRFGARSGADAIDPHVLSNREGSIGGGGGSAGGCGCN